MIRYIRLIIVMCITGFNCISQTSADKTFDWLVGKWEVQTGKGKFFEYWKKGNNGTLEANGGELIKNDTVFKEWINLIKIKNYWCYIPVIDKQQPIIFAMVENKNKRYVFENKEHDFPQKIVYEHIDSLRLNVRVEGKQNGKEIKEDYFLKRIK